MTTKNINWKKITPECMPVQNKEYWIMDIGSPTKAVAHIDINGDVVFNVLGQYVSDIAEFAEIEDDTHNVRWRTDTPEKNGVYFCMLKCNYPQEKIIKSSILYDGEEFGWEVDYDEKVIAWLDGVPEFIQD